MAALESKPVVGGLTALVSLIILLAYTSARNTIDRAAPVMFWMFVAIVGILLVFFIWSQLEKLLTLRAQMIATRSIAQSEAIRANNEANAPLVIKAQQGEQIIVRDMDVASTYRKVTEDIRTHVNGHHQEPSPLEVQLFMIRQGGYGGQRDAGQLMIDQQSVMGSAPTRTIPERVEYSDVVDSPSTHGLVLGVSSGGQIVSRSINDMVHIAIAGVTRSGKSIFIQQLLHQIINAPQPTKLYLVDLGGTTFIDFGLPYASTIEEAEMAVHQVMNEAMRRKDLYEATGRGVRSLRIYNEITGSNLPQIFLAIDEALYLMEESKEIASGLKLVVSWAAKYGITVIFISQDIKANVISTATRNNFSTRFQFLAEDEVQANILVKGCDAHLIQQRGRCFARFPGDNSIIELQTPFISETQLVGRKQEIEKPRPIAGSYDMKVCRAWHETATGKSPSGNKMHKLITQNNVRINGRQKQNYVEILQKYGINPGFLEKSI